MIGIVAEGEREDGVIGESARAHLGHVGGAVSEAQNPANRSVRDHPH